VIVCSSEGEVRAYLPAGEELDAMGTTAVADRMEDDTLQELSQRKQELLFELKQYEEQSRKVSTGQRAAGAVASDTRVTARLESSTADECLYLELQASNDALIKAAVVFALDGKVFEHGESYAVHSKAPTSTIRVPLRPPKDVGAELQVRAIAGGHAMPTFHVFELTQSLPKFCMYSPVDPRKSAPPSAGVTCVLPGAAARVRDWILTTFNLEQPPAAEKADAIEQAFVSLRDGRPLWLRMTPEAGGTMHVLTEDMELAGEVLQELASSLGLKELESLAEFPSEMEAFRAVLLRVDEFHSARLKLTAAMADQSNTAKTLVVKAEDARILGDIKSMRAAYAQLHSLNAELLGEYSKRANNHEQLMASLKEVNQMTEKAARLRVGAPKARVVSSCRQAIKANNMHSLFKIIKSGHA
jgi:Bardet-Biedl syndrome 2 protein